MKELFAPPTVSLLRGGVRSSVPLSILISKMKLIVLYWTVNILSAVQAGWLPGYLTTNPDIIRFEAGDVVGCRGKFWDSRKHYFLAVSDDAFVHLFEPSPSYIIYDEGKILLQTRDQWIAMDPSWNYCINFGLLSDPPSAAVNRALRDVGRTVFVQTDVCTSHFWIRKWAGHPGLEGSKCNSD